MKTRLLLFVLFAFSFGNAQTLIHNFPFDGSYNDAVGSSYYFQNGSFFRTDRNGNPLKAIEVNSVNGGIAGGAMPDIPVGTNHRTISIWVKFLPSANSFDRYFIFGYGGNGENQGFNLTQAFSPVSAVSTLQVSTAGFSSVNSVNTTVAVDLNVWYHYVVSFNGSVVKVYRNNQLLINQTVSGWSTTIANGALRLGNNTVGQSTTSPIYLDDLQVYNYVLNDAEITNLFTNNTLSSQNFSQNNLEAALYPNPVNDILNIKMDSGIQSVEVFNLQGQKVKSSNQKQINVSDLAAGIYMVRIQDTDNAIATKKIVKQ
jgi:hypothetical protein